MSNYGTTNHSHGRRDSENQILLDGQPISTEANDTFYGRTVRHVHHNRVKYFFLWCLAAVTSISVVVSLFYYNKNRHDDGSHTPAPGKDLLDILGKHGDDDVCQSDRSYPVAILLSVFLGVFGIDRFYLGYIISSVLKLVTGGGLGIWYIIDIILIVIGALPDHSGCTLIS
ncbi:hypothetical protein BG011_009128 [Mortierella polycephala]|uniref:TM2 domain-containing protein n=1 Tax=Mortierella polycephala TaxID=41804 RepID=A0A9P6PNL9_9FUNG|nr:hypothetical protein BG011_009128 [Mortierella polycephala]